MTQDSKSQEEELAELRNELLLSLKPYEFKENFTLQDLVDELDGSDKKPQAAKRFRSAGEHCADSRSTAFTFLFIGIPGLAASIASILGVLHLPLQGSAIYTMAVLFTGFILFGLYSIKKSQKYFSAIKEEEAQIKAIKKWYHEVGVSTANLLIAEETDPAGEERYLRKYSIVGLILKKQFPNAAEDLLDKLAADLTDETES